MLEQTTLFTLALKLVSNRFTIGSLQSAYVQTDLAKPHHYVVWPKAVFHSTLGPVTQLL